MKIRTDISAGTMAQFDQCMGDCKADGIRKKDCKKACAPCVMTDAQYPSCRG